VAKKEKKAAKVSKQAKKVSDGEKKPVLQLNMEQFQPKIKSTSYDPKVEKKIFEEWQKKGLFKFDQKIKKPVFSIDTPPPYVNTPVHIGQAYTYVWMDIIARYRRMCGFNVLFPVGLDKNGLPIEIQTEREFNISMHDTPRDQFIAMCKKVLKKSGDITLDSFKKLGLSCNSWEINYNLGGRYDTDDPEFRKLTQIFFIELWKKGLIYEDLKPTNYCPVCRTTISDAEVEYEEVKTTLNYIKFFVKETGDFIIVATTRPELLCTCKVILFNPNDERYKHLEGKTAIVPIFRQEVRIMAHPFADQNFGSGLVMICSFGDYGDVRLLRELDINPTYAINDQGRMNKNAGVYIRMKVEEARAKIIEDLKLQGLIERQAEIVSRQPICWRSKNVVEFIPMKEFYLKQLQFRDDLLKMANEMVFFAPESRQILIDWINALNIDWVISRRRYYGTEVPLWYCQKCKYVFVPQPGKYYQPWREDAPIKVCPKCGCETFVGETRTFDTWFDSSNSPFYILGYLRNREFFKRHTPCSLRPQGKEIVRTWLYFTLLKSYHLFKKKPFETCWINMHVVDEKGEKMSKSLGNIIDPQDVIKQFGAEAFRIWSCIEGDITRSDIRCSFERIAGASKFLTKVWNIARFISSFPITDKRNAALTSADRWMLAELAKLVADVKVQYENYNFSAVAEAIRNFTWNIFAAHYIEMVKKRAYGFSSKNEQRGAWYTLHYCMKTVLQLLAPIMPFITERIWQELYSKQSIHLQSYPSQEWKSQLVELTAKLLEFNSMVWNGKKQLSLTLRDTVKVTIPKNLKQFENDLVAMHSIDMKSLNVIKAVKPEEEKPRIEEKEPKEKIVEKKAAKKAKKK